MMALIRDGEVIVVKVPAALSTSASSTELVSSAITCLTKAFLTTSVSNYPGYWFCGSYQYFTSEHLIVVIFIAGHDSDSLFTGGGFDEDFLIRELQAYLEEAVYDYLSLLGESPSLEACAGITVENHVSSAN